MEMSTCCAVLFYTGLGCNVNLVLGLNLGWVWDDVVWIRIRQVETRLWNLRVRVGVSGDLVVVVIMAVVHGKIRYCGWVTSDAMLSVR